MSDRDAAESPATREVRARWRFARWQIDVGEGDELIATSTRDVRRLAEDLAEGLAEGLAEADVRLTYVMPQDVAVCLARAEQCDAHGLASVAAVERRRAARLLRSKRMTADDIAEVLGVDVDEVVRLIGPA
ncbi:hypothetical protein [Herbiconiux daphne]|uniref:Uncharacterized protein n=1 Tax=Herbiconiux daphne TaxID=2970914 RepID=A0ABT2GZV2_9MICO|nr:hypothetical protein [Herbiconiux daphne]MCS5732266.1 hypothetical protein [Herbiconiux daphne]